jgi:shikimate dehydrogenase
LKKHFSPQKENQKTAIILGNGGAAKAVQYVLKKNQIPYITVSRTTEINYENLSENQSKRTSSLFNAHLLALS